MTAADHLGLGGGREVADDHRDLLGVLARRRVELGPVAPRRHVRPSPGATIGVDRIERIGHDRAASDRAQAPAGLLDRQDRRPAAASGTFHTSRPDRDPAR